MTPSVTPSGRFGRVATAGIAFQAGSTAVDSATIMAALVFQLTGSPLLVGAVPAVLRFGWLFPQFFVGYLAGRSRSSMPYYAVGAFGRTTMIALLALLLWFGAGWTRMQLGLAVMGLWTLYAFASGIVAAPYNDIVARAVPSQQRSRLLATRFFGGGVLALGIAVLADRALAEIPFPTSYAAIMAMAASLMLISAIVFVGMGEPGPPDGASASASLGGYFRDGIEVFRRDADFRSFVFAQWCGGAVLMAAPFYIVSAQRHGVPPAEVAALLAAQTAGALLSNLLWGWWGDRRGKASLMATIARLRILPPLLPLGLLGLGAAQAPTELYAALFFLLGAISNGLTIAVIGLLMEISPNEKRPAYSGYFNAMTAPAFLSPLLAGALAQVFALELVFALSLVAAVGQAYFVNRIRVA